MRDRTEMSVAALRSAGEMFERNVSGVTLDEAVQAVGGYRSVLGILKHAAGWSHVYYSYAFEEAPRHWVGVAWPRGLRDTIEPSREYLDEMRAWFGESREKWVTSVRAVVDEEMDAPRRVHWGAAAPLFDIVVMVANHWVYHAGEMNALLSILRGEAWEYTEEVEENHISTAGHRLRPGWMSEEQLRRYEAYLEGRDRELRGGGA